jgi:hypothetical protein
VGTADQLAPLVGAMKQHNLEIEPYRIMDFPDERTARACVGSNNGAFRLPGGIVVIASDGEGWDHVSVSLQDRCPTWDEMKRAKEMFFTEDEAAFQIFPPKAMYRNFHPFCLHWWRPQGQTIPLPEPLLVAP